jgi:hypothetical protein
MKGKNGYRRGQCISNFFDGHFMGSRFQKDTIVAVDNI